MAANLTELRKSLRGVLLADAQLLALLGGERIYYRPARRTIEPPEITFFDYGSSDPLVPLLTRVFQFDTWTKDTDQTEEIGERIETLLDFQTRGLRGLAPFTLTAGGLRLRRIRLERDWNEYGGLEGDEVVRKAQLFRLFAYQDN